MSWKRRIGAGLGVVAGLLAAAAAWAWVTKPWAIPLEVLDPGPTGVRVNEAGVIGNYYPAEGAVRGPAVLIFGGSEGGLGPDVTRHARALQSAGYSALHLAWWRPPTASPKLENIPIERFETALRWLGARPEVDPKRLAVFGWSRGSEPAQMLAVHHPEIRAVVLGTPANALFPGFDWDAPWSAKESAWTYRGKALPAVRAADFKVKRTPASHEAAGILNALAKRPEAEIPIERIAAPVLMICGEADRVWRACPMARLGQARAKAHGKHDVTILAYKDAGHYVYGAPVARTDPAYATRDRLGGTVEATNAGLADSWAQTKAFLATALAGS